MEQNSTLVTRFTCPTCGYPLSALALAGGFIARRCPRCGKPLGEDDFDMLSIRLCIERRQLEFVALDACRELDELLSKPRILQLLLAPIYRRKRARLEGQLTLVRERIAQIDGELAKLVERRRGLLARGNAARQIDSHAKHVYANPSPKGGRVA